MFFGQALERARGVRVTNEGAAGIEPLEHDGFAAELAQADALAVQVGPGSLPFASTAVVDGSPLAASTDALGCLLQATSASPTTALENP
jgi:hypothetical protein